MHHTNPRSRLALVVVCVLLVAGLAWGLTGAFASSGSPSPSSGKIVLKVGWTVEPDNLNPFIGYETSSFEVWSLNYDQLTEKNAKDFGPGQSPNPNARALATSWEMSPDGKTWTFHLRPNAKFSDGTPCTAADVAFTYNYIVKNNLYAFTVATDGIKQVVAVDPTTVKFILKAPKADLLRLWIPILPQHIWGKVDPNTVGTSYVAKIPIVGSGPFYVADMKKGNYVHMVRNPYYWGTKPAVTDIYFQVYTNADTMCSDLKLGNIDAAWGIPQAQLKPLQGTKGLTAISYNFFNWDYLNFNTLRSNYGYAAGWTKSLGNPVLQDPAFRHAFNWAIDKQALVNVAWNGNATPGTTIMTPNTWQNPDYHWQPSASEMYTYDPTKAGQELDAAGYKLVNGTRVDNNGKPIVLRMMVPSDSQQHLAEAKLIVGELAAIGIKVNFTPVDAGTMSAKIWNYTSNSTYEPDFDIYIWDWDGYADPGQTLQCYVSTQIGGWNEPNWENPQFDKLAQQQNQTMDLNARKDIIWQMQQIMYDQTPQIVLTYPNYLEAYNTDKWTGWTRVMNGHGPAFYTDGNLDTYLNLKPQAASSSSGAKGVWIAVVAVVVVVVIAIVVWMTTRKKAHVEEA